MQSRLTFFCELDGSGLKRLFENRFVFDDLKLINASVSMAMIDFSPERTEVVQRLNQLGIPVIAWLLLPGEEGFRLSISKYQSAQKRYEDFKDWSDANGLIWEGIGLDIEPQFNQLMDSHRPGLRAIKNTVRAHLLKKPLKQANLAYRELALAIKDDGYSLEAYHFPLIIEEQKTSTLFSHGLGGMLDVPVDREVLMLYSSLFNQGGRTLMWSYADEAQAIGIGVTKKSRLFDNPEELIALDWDAFSQDLRLAWQTDKPVYVFNLEGCVEQGFLSRLVTFNWGGKVEKPKTAFVKQARKGFNRILWLIEQPLIILVGLASVVGMLSALRKRKTSKKNAK